MRILWRFLFLLAGCFLGVSCQSDNRIKMLQLNVWQDATQVEGAFDAIVNEIVEHQPDIVTLCEVRNYNGVNFTECLCQSLNERGCIYYTFNCLDGGIISKYPILESSILETTTINRAVVRIGSQKVAVYAAHLDYTHYACYLPRGYDGVTWKECAIPESVDEILSQNNASKRIRQIECLMQQAERDLSDSCLIIIGGDFNEPSWMDWKEDTKDLYDHRGFVIPWTTTKRLDENGYKDAYRELYPSAVTHPGFTWVADNIGKEIKELAWAPNADERDRIDFIFYKGEGIKPVDAAILGPKGSIVRGQRVLETSQDSFLEPLGVWPTDHKGILVTLQIK